MLKPTSLPLQARSPISPQPRLRTRTPSGRFDKVPGYVYTQHEQLILSQRQLKASLCAGVLARDRRLPLEDFLCMYAVESSLALGALRLTSV